MNSIEQPINMKALAWTVGVHVLLLLLFILFKYSVPTITDPFPEMGMEVNLGTSDNGYGTDQPMVVDEPAPDNASATNAHVSPAANTTRDMLRAEEPNAPAVNTPVNTTNTNRNNTAANTNTRRNTSQQTATNTNTQQQRPRYVYNGGTGRGGNAAQTNIAGGNEGNTNGDGDRGVPAGTPGASNYTGVPGRGNGISHTLTGRNIVAYPNPDADFREGGKVVVRVTVNRAGVITNKQIVSASNAELRVIALRKVEKIQFNKSEDSPEEQFGNITFVFKTRS
jgi:TonB family protein